MPTQTIGRYEIVRELGRGAMGIVYEARDPNIGRTVALKTIRVDVASAVSEEVMRRFKNEARAAGKLNHPNIVTVYDAGDHEGLFYMALECMEGGTLQELLAQKGRLPTEQVLSIIRQVCAGLDFAHARGIVHRDVKPANVMFGPQAVAKITDFGIANIGDGMTMTGTVLGTPNYMSPEQVLGKPLDGRSDLFGVGVMLYEMVTGERPFEGQNITTVMYKIVHETPVPPRKLDGTIPSGLSAVIEKALEKSPESRYPSGAALAEALQNYQALGDAMATATSVIPLARADAPTPAMPLPAAAAGQPRRKSRAKWWLLVMLALMVWALLWSRRGKEAPSNTVPQPQSTQSAPAAPVPPPQPAAPSEHAGLVEHKPATPVGDKALIKLNSSPPTAEIWLDGKSTGKRTPADLELERGEHNISVRLGGFQEAGARFRVKGGEEFEFAPTLSPAIPAIGQIPMPKIDLRGLEKMPGLSEAQQQEIEALQRWGQAAGSHEPALLINSVPRGARVLVDGQDSGKTTPAVIPMQPGTYHVRVEQDGFQPGEKKVTVGERKPGIVNLRLKPLAP